MNAKKLLIIALTFLFAFPALAEPDSYSGGYSDLQYEIRRAIMPFAFGESLNGIRAEVGHMYSALDIQRLVFVSSDTKAEPTPKHLMLSANKQSGKQQQCFWQQAFEIKKAIANPRDAKVLTDRGISQVTLALFDTSAEYYNAEDSKRIALISREDANYRPKVKMGQRVGGYTMTVYAQIDFNGDCKVITANEIIGKTAIRHLQPVVGPSANRDGWKSVLQRIQEGTIVEVQGEKISNSSRKFRYVPPPVPPPTDFGTR
jgi:hypothetical protein